MDTSPCASVVLNTTSCNSPISLKAGRYYSHFAEEERSSQRMGTPFRGPPSTTLLVLPEPSMPGTPLTPAG